MIPLPVRTSAILLLTVPLGAPSDAGAQTGAAERRIGADISYLAADVREGRGVGTDGLDSAASYIAARFEEAGLLPGGPNGFLQPFAIDSSAPAAAHAGLGGTPVANVVGIRPGRGALATQAVVIGAHYDHLGYGGFGSCVRRPRRNWSISSRRCPPFDRWRASRFLRGAPSPALLRPAPSRSCLY